MLKNKTNINYIPYE